MTKPKTYTRWSCHCGNVIKLEVPVVEVLCSRTLACRRADRERGGRPMLEVKQ